MSGICGYFRQNGKVIEEEVLAGMLFLLERQGPDDKAYWKSTSVALGHTLLKTTRESDNESQPSTLDGQVWLTADARIDGRDVLIGKLNDKGVSVSEAATDDHLILQAYACWDTDCLEHLIGDFAFILWDERQKKLFCATDHMGVSPLYYAQVEGGFLVSNNVSAIRAHPEISDILNEQAIGDYILFRMNQVPESTSFRDIKKLPSGNKIIVTKDKVQFQKYWTPPKPNYVWRSKKEYIEQCRALFRTAVSDRLRADGAGTHLSGGMDSTSIAAILAELKAEGRTNDIRAYTHIDKIEYMNLEQPFAEKVAKKLDIPIYFYPGGEALEPDILDIADLPPEPSFSRRKISRFELLDDSLQYSRVFFTGYGGDPLLLPDKRYWSGLRRSGRFIRHLIDAWHHWKIHGKLPAAIVSEHFRPKRRPLKSASLPEWLNDDFVARNKLIPRAPLSTDMREDMAGSALWRRVFEWQSSAYSQLPVKIQFPFFDIRLVNWFQTVPPYPWLHSKYLLRAIMETKLPQEVLSRPKTALPGNPLKAKIEETTTLPQLEIIERSDELKFFVDIKGFLHKVSDPNTLTNTDAKFIVRLSTLAHWLENYKKFGSYARENHANITRYKKR